MHEGQIIGRGMNDTNRSLNVCSVVDARQQLASTAILDQLQLFTVLMSNAGDPTR